MKGSYILVLQVERPLIGLQVGRLGRFDFASGFYLYVGSAFGPGGLAARLRYHERQQKARPHWHIDYLRSHARLRQAWAVSDPRRLECRWCEALRLNPACSVPAPGFGARDTGCLTHLFALARAPQSGFLTALILDSIATDQPAAIKIEIHSFD